MRAFGLLAAPILLAALAMPSAAEQKLPINPQVDYAGFNRLVGELAPVREAHRLQWAEFRRRSNNRNALLLDARSPAAFASGHIRGAVNLPFSDFTDDALREVIGRNPDRPIYIYCNNNFSDNIYPVVTKRVELALNIPTFINLHGYGYRNVWELADVVKTRDLGADWVSNRAR
ncbi:MAG: rhodanese-like domain-containing protein [Novosphingobium sp.]